MGPGSSIRTITHAQIALTHLYIHNSPLLGSPSPKYSAIIKSRAYNYKVAAAGMIPGRYHCSGTRLYPPHQLLIIASACR